MQYDGVRCDTILEITFSNLVIARALYAFAKLGIADLLGDGTASSAELASRAGAGPAGVVPTTGPASILEAVPR